MLFSILLALAGPTSDIPPRREFPIDQAISPCKDFYAYACNQVDGSFKLREDRSRHVFAFSDSSERILETKKDYFLKPPENLSVRGQELQDFYQACMNVEASKKEERLYVEKLKTRIDALKTREEFLNLLGENILSEDYSFLSFGSIANLQDSKKEDLYLLADLQSLPERSYYAKKDVVAGLRETAVDLFKILGRSEPTKRADRVMAFEKEFSKSYPLPAEFRELFNKPTQIERSDFLAKYPTLKIARVFEAVPERILMRHITPANFEFLNKKLAELDLETLKDIYLFHELPGYMDDAYPEYFKKRFDFQHKYLGGPAERSDRQERCTKKVMGRFTKELDAELLPKMFPDFPKQKFVRLVEKVRYAIILGMEKNKWLSPKARTEAIHKMRVARLQLVAPENDAEWDFNIPADYRSDEPYSNDRLYRRKVVEKELRDIRVERDPNRWAMGPLTVNAYYSPPDNKFVMPIGILQYPFYDPALPEHVNMGAVGAVIGHELGHGIDDKGSRYNAKGQMIPWMSEKDLSEFKKRGAGLVSQFNKIGHNGELTLGENIGDLVGMSFAYQASGLDRVQGPEAQKRKQEFFLQFARLWCHVVRPKTRELLLKTDPHAASDERVNQQVIHQEGFAQAYGCKKGDAMFLPAEKRVKIW